MAVYLGWVILPWWQGPQLIFLMRNSALLLLEIGGVRQSESYASPSFATEDKRSSETKSTQVFFRTVCSCKLVKVFPVVRVLTYRQIGFLPVFQYVIAG